MAPNLCSILTQYVIQAIVLMTDGVQTYAEDQVSLSVAMKPLKDASVFSYAIGIGPEIAREELKIVADGNVVVASNFDELLKKIDLQIGLIGRGGCKGKPFVFLIVSFLIQVLFSAEVCFVLFRKLLFR